MTQPEKSYVPGCCQKPGCTMTHSGCLRLKHPSKRDLPRVELNFEPAPLPAWLRSIA